MYEPQITVVGNLVADPELRVSQGSGNEWVTFRVAATPRIKDRQTQAWTDGETLWLGCRAYGEMAQNIAKSIRKGDRVLVQGRLSARTYTDSQGQQRTSLDLDVDEIGPSLWRAVAQVTRIKSGGQSGQFGAAPVNHIQPQGQSGWVAAESTPWNPSAGGAIPPQRAQGDLNGAQSGGLNSDLDF
ncbi:single-stranded DNA-binding protein [Canibacter sp. lx-45]|uniref:single-stranded DNA-binding protein n=1 Tax=Canibacter zhuwentaonis TaxID=2837491 RepID=UPI001BDC3527|nr:single-stranded DNA-binding protein [Canibacter zhuwentaonis]MBT1035366.1 single-stranded DNA-binding protein [Canibacter zhuwentaonis]